jgi:hypothetical protein
VIIESSTGHLIDAVRYDGPPQWPLGSGVSMQFTDLSQDNDIGSKWGKAAARGGTFGAPGADLGTPGE